VEGNCNNCRETWPQHSTDCDLDLAPLLLNLLKFSQS
jgi:hypothetical protein